MLLVTVAGCVLVGVDVGIRLELRLLVGVVVLLLSSPPFPCGCLRDKPWNKCIAPTLCVIYKNTKNGEYKVEFTVELISFMPGFSFADGGDG